MTSSYRLENKYGDRRLPTAHCQLKTAFEESRTHLHLLLTHLFPKPLWISLVKGEKTCLACFFYYYYRQPIVYLKSIYMLRWTVIFLIVAIIAAVFGFGGIAAGAAGIAKVLFFIFIVLFLISLIGGRRSADV
jgi:uncharacterized membrane protein YtjA (UPF0391 family)